MANQFVKITRKSWFHKIAGSFIGALIGVLLFFGSFVVLWMNEGRTDFSVIARTSQSATPDRIDSANEGRFVSVTGALAAPDPIGDEPYLRPGPYVALSRSVEMYAWVEHQSSETRDNVGGGSTTKTTYTYKQEWTSSPADSSSFEVPQGHTNPPMSIEERDVVAPRAAIGAYQIDTGSIELPGRSDLPLRSELVSLRAGQRLDGSYIYQGEGTLESPALGDMRISYQALANGERVTAFGRQQGDMLRPFAYSTDGEFYRALSGDRNTAIEALRSEYVILGWVLRLVGFLMMWIGLALSFGPISAFLDVLPALGDASGCLIGAVTFAVALGLSAITIVIAVIAHNVILMILLVVLLLGGFYLWGRMRGKRAAPAA